jgi:hypothetical protein
MAHSQLTTGLLGTPSVSIPDLSISSPIGRWTGIGPYYAMFPIPFAFDVVARYSKPGGAVLDPFAGRASSIYAAVAQGRTGYGVELNPVGWLYGAVKLAPAAKAGVLRRIREIGEFAGHIRRNELDELPEFFHMCYCESVLKYLLAGRQHLKWKTSRIDATLMAVILVNLHGKKSHCLSNQMRQGKAMDPAYAVRWWNANNMVQPPERDPVKFLTDRIEWRYAKGLPALGRGHIELGDSTTVLKRLSGHRRSLGAPRFDLLFTSPPYCGITNYFYDQWLRIWMLGGPSKPVRREKQWEKKFRSKTEYRELLEKVFEDSARCLKRGAVIYVRTDAREFTFETTRDVLTEVFPKKQMLITYRPIIQATQTALYGDKTEKPGEIDIIMK